MSVESVETNNNTRNNLLTFNKFFSFNFLYPNNKKMFSTNHTSIIKYTCYKICVFVIDFVSVYLIWIFIHIISANMYVYFCADLSVYGVISSIFITQSPHCSALRYAIDTGVGIINSMWATVGVWLTNSIINMNIKLSSDKQNKHQTNEDEMN